MKLTRLALLALLLAGLTASAGVAGEGISGYMFGDYYYVVSADDAETESAYGGTIPGDLPEKRNALQFRRMYLTYDKDIADNFSVRYRLEAKDKGFGEGDKMIPFVKHAYLKWKKALIGADLYLGLSGTPTWKNAEKVWGYRSVEMTVLDLNKFGSSSDLGAALKGKAGKVGYHLMVGNGPGQKPEGDNGKKLYGSAVYGLAEGVSVEGYADFDMRPGDQNRWTVKGLAGIVKDSFRGGVEPFMRVHQKSGQGGDDVTITGVSAYGTLKLAEKTKGFGRVDMVSEDDMDTTNMLVLVGADYMPVKDVHLMPNVRVELPDGPDPNIQARLTFFYKFK